MQVFHFEKFITCSHALDQQWATGNDGDFLTNLVKIFDVFLCDRYFFFLHSILSSQQQDLWYLVFHEFCTHIIGYINSHVSIHFWYLNMLDARIRDGVQDMESLVKME